MNYYEIHRNGTITVGYGETVVTARAYDGEVEQFYGVRYAQAWLDTK